MKTIRRSLILCLLLPLLCLSVCAAGMPGEDISPEQGLDEDVVSQIGPYTQDVGDDFFTRLQALLGGSILRLDLLGWKDVLRTVGLILAAVLLCGLLQTQQGPGRCAGAAACLAVTAACTGDLRSMLALGTQTVDNIHSYLRLLLPGMTTLMVSSGSVTGAGAMSALAGAGFTLLLRLLTGVLVPLVYVFAALSAAEAVLGQGNLAQLRDFVKWLVTICLKGIFYGFSACLTLTGVFTGAVDAQKAKTVRFAISGMVPMVGNLVSGASETVVRAAQTVKNSVGIYGMLAVLGLCLTPFLKIGLQYGMLKLTTAVCGLFGRGNCVGLLEKLTEAMGMILAMTGIACLLALLFLALCVRAAAV